MLEKEGILATCIYIYVANEEERIEYEMVLHREKYYRLVVGEPGIVAQRQFIVQQWEEGKRLVLLDDDIESVDLRLTRFENLEEFFCEAFEECNREGSYMWGVYPVFNPYFRKGRKEVSYGLQYIIAAFHGIINRPLLQSLQLVCSQSNPYKEDVERTILYFRQDGVTVRFNLVGFRTRYYGTTGGLGTFNERLVPSKEAAMSLYATYPEYGRIKERKNGMTEFVLRRLKHA